MAKKRSYKGKKQYASYKNEGRYSSNKIKKLIKHANSHPNDSVAVHLLSKAPFSYKRKPSRSKLEKVKKLVTYGNGSSKTIGEQFELLGLAKSYTTRNGKVKYMRI